MWKSAYNPQNSLNQISLFTLESQSCSQKQQLFQSISFVCIFTLLKSSSLKDSFLVMLGRSIEIFKRYLESTVQNKEALKLNVRCELFRISLTYLSVGIFYYLAVLYFHTLYSTKNFKCQICWCLFLIPILACPVEPHFLQSQTLSPFPVNLDNNMDLPYGVWSL